jgi:hypothetical protein
LELGLDLFFFWWSRSKADCRLVLVFNDSFSSKTLALSEVFPRPLRWFIFVAYVTCAPQPQVQGMRMGGIEEEGTTGLTFKLHNTSSENFLYQLPNDWGHVVVGYTGYTTVPVLLGVDSLQLDIDFGGSELGHL